MCIPIGSTSSPPSIPKRDYSASNASRNTAGVDNGASTLPRVRIAVVVVVVVVEMEMERLCPLLQL